MGIGISKRKAEQLPVVEEEIVEIEEPDPRKRIDLGSSVYITIATSIYEEMNLQGLTYKAFVTEESVDDRYTSLWHEYPITAIIEFKPSSTNTLFTSALTQEGPFRTWLKDPVDKPCFEVDVADCVLSFTDFYRVVIKDGEEWYPIEAVKEANFVQFRCFPMEKFFIVKYSYRQQFSLSADGECVKCKKDERVMFDFPRNTVIQDEEMTLTIANGNRSKVEESADGNLILKVSPLVEIGCNQVFRRSFKVRLPVKHIPGAIGNSLSPSLALIVFACNDGKVQKIIRNPEYEEAAEQPGCYIFEMGNDENFKSVAAAVVKFDDINHVTPLMAELALGMKYQCNILVFSSPVDGNCRVRSVCFQENMSYAARTKYGGGLTECSDQTPLVACVEAYGLICIYVKGKCKLIGNEKDAKEIFLRFIPNFINHRDLQIKIHVDRNGERANVYMNFKHKTESWPFHEEIGTVSIISRDSNFRRPDYRVINRPGVLSPRSIDNLVRQLTFEDIQSIGVQLNIRNAELSRLREEARNVLQFGRSVLNTWKTNVGDRTPEELHSELINALRSMGRNDVAEVVKRVCRLGRDLEIGDFRE